jgi:hypothetical protein
LRSRADVNLTDGRRRLGKVSQRFESGRCVLGRGARMR